LVDLIEYEVSRTQPPRLVSNRRLFLFCTTIMSEAKLKSLKVVDLKDILAKASVSVPAKANKQDLIARVLANPAALDVYNKQQNPTSAPPVSAAATDDLVSPFTTF
jgi:hypothetical protein